ncbi:hypothetical protein KQX54_013433 [Cotesia glomerata]|uniref:Uncharacterized protein n=1 Tax=Cotesia glomerata TaxID=32391 RepID=A0AAV7IDM1_COTGL|nr:hypothetical protein KQX54_013433 [Cotesia glomerata]
MSYLQNFKPVLTPDRHIITSRDGLCLFVDTRSREVVFVKLKIYRPADQVMQPDDEGNDDEAFGETSLISDEDAA